MTLHSSLKMLAAAAFLVTSAQMAHAEQHQDTVHDARGNIVVNTFGNCVNTKWPANDAECKQAASTAAAEVKQVAPEHNNVALDQRTVYFEFNKSGLTAESKGRLNALADILSADRQVKQARIVGYADRIGGAAYNEKLSQKRAETVQDYLVSRGFINAHVAETRWLGSSTPRTHCSNKLPHKKLIACLQQDRRVEVEIEYNTGK